MTSRASTSSNGTLPTIGTENTSLAASKISVIWTQPTVMQGMIFPKSPSPGCAQNQQPG